MEVWELESSAAHLFKRQPLLPSPGRKVLHPALLLPAPCVSSPSPSQTQRNKVARGGWSSASSHFCFRTRLDRINLVATVSESRSTGNGPTVPSPPRSFGIVLEGCSARDTRGTTRLDLRSSYWIRGWPGGTFTASRADPGREHGIILSLSL